MVFPLRLVRILAAVALLVTVGWIAPPAHACACGAMEPQSSRELGVNSETAAIVFDGQTETIALSMGLETDSSAVAFLLPLPAEASLGLAGTDLFGQLFDHTRPEVRTRYDYSLGSGDGTSAGSPQGGATEGASVVGRQRVGDYDVAQLTGTADGVARWLADNEFRTRPAVMEALGDYLDQGWIVLAAKLVFEGSEFSGPMVPLVVSFPTDQLVYPMKLSQLATSTQHLRFYVLADHRQDVSIGQQMLPTYFAGWVDGPSLRASGHDDVAALVGDRRWFLTRVDGAIRPDRITSDLAFVESTAGDSEHREVVWRTERRGWVVVLAGTLGVGVVLVGAGVTALIAYRSGKRVWRGER